VNSSLAMVQTTNPSQLILKLTWNNERPARSYFTFGESKKSAVTKYSE
jgi:hypothetical protein